MQSSDFKELTVWQKAMDLVTEVYNLTSKYPKEEVYGLISQIRRSAVSIPSNIAEGQSRYNKNDFIRFLHYARGSAAELETQLLISENLGFVTLQEIEGLLNELKLIGRMTVNLVNSLEKA